MRQVLFVLLSAFVLVIGTVHVHSQQVPRRTNGNAPASSATNSQRRTNADLVERVPSTQSTTTERGYFTYFGESVPANIRHFGSDNAAEAVVDQILNTAGLTSRTFTTRAANVPNAAAEIGHGGERRLLYNPSFITNTERRTGTRWAGISIMAHEIAHHLQGHTLEGGGGSTPPTELEADDWSGFILRQMGATLADAQAVMDLIGSDTGSRTHPARRQRLRAIEEGWSRAGNNDTGTDAPRRCERDGGRWTGYDCEYPPPPQLMCATAFGVFPMYQAAPVGYPCNVRGYPGRVVAY